jgi:hypothetical protein
MGSQELGQLVEGSPAAHPEGTWDSVAKMLAVQCAAVVGPNQKS